jgi:hypothetical protein
VPEGADVTAWKVRLPGDVRSLSPRMAMIIMTHVTWLRWGEYAALLEQQMLDPINAALAGEPSTESAGLVGHTWASDPKSGETYATGEQVRALAALEAEERDRVMRYARQCHDAGLLGDDW